MIPHLRWAIPVSVTGPHTFVLLGLWNMPPYRDDLNAVRTYHRLLKTNPAVVAGDFNNWPDRVWRGDGPLQDGDPARADDGYVFLRDIPSVSAYNKYWHEPMGSESKPTHYWLYRRDKGFHFDYCFVPESWRLKSVRVGTFRSWVQTRLSDHVPLIVDVQPETQWRSRERLAV
jgi:endonuclease/exonuclease/phosphatase family metal-dependent hydrolase